VKILIVQDEFMIGQFIYESIQHADFDVELVQTGQIACSLCLIDHYDALILLNTLPANDWCKKIREKGVGIPIIQYYFLLDLSNWLEYFDFKVCDCLALPFESEHLFHKLYGMHYPL